MMSLRRFFSYFGRVQVPDPDKLMIAFRLKDGTQLTVSLVSFELEKEVWTVELALPPANGASEDRDPPS